jgi:hypothetical protein
MKSQQTHLTLFLTIIGTLVILLSYTPEASAVAPPANDNFVNAETIFGVGTSITSTNVEATKEVGEPNHAGNPGGKSVWYKFSPTIGSAYGITLYTQNSVTDFDTLIAVYTGSSVDNLTLVTSNDNYGTDPRSRVIFPAGSSSTFYIAVDGLNGASGNFRLEGRMNVVNSIATNFDPMLGDDFAVFRPSTGTWYARRTVSSGFISQQWGQGGDVPVPADYDGDATTDFAVWRPSTGVWYILRSATNTLMAVAWGTTGDKPVSGDYDADGIADIAVFRPSNGTWYIHHLPSGATTFQHFGKDGDKPAQRDYDGDGKMDLAVFRPSNGGWYILNSFSGSVRAQQWGQVGDIPVPSEYELSSDGRADIAVFRPANGTWYALLSLSNSLLAVQWGQSGDIPQPSNWLGPTLANFTVYRPSDSTWYFREAYNASYSVSERFGAPGDIPVTSAYVVEP